MNKWYYAIIYDINFDFSNLVTEAFKCLRKLKCHLRGSHSGRYIIKCRIEYLNGSSDYTTIIEEGYITNKGYLKRTDK